MSNLFYKRIAKDCKQALIQLVSEAGHGKTSSLRTIIDYCKKNEPDLQFVIFDVSQAWYHCAPVKHRQLVTLEKIINQQVVNITDCVYELGQLSEEHRRAFVGKILSLHYNKRYEAKLKGELDDFPSLIFIMEESNIYFGSYALRKNDEHSAVFQNYVSVGRNYKMRGFLIATAEQGEMSPSLRRRTRKIYGRIISKPDLSAAKRLGITEDLTTIPRYHFHYRGITQRIPDLVKNVPVEYVVEQVTVEIKKSKFNAEWWAKFFGTLFVFWLFWSWLMQV